MNKKQQQVMGMGKNTLAVLDTQPALWSRFAPLAQTVEEARTTVNTLGRSGAEQSDGYTHGHTLNKKAQKELVVDLALNLVSKLRSFARMTRHLVLLEAIDFSKTRLEKGNEFRLMQRWQLIHDKAKEHLAQLGPYEVNAKVLQTYQQAIQTFDTLSSKRDLVKDKRVATTSNLDTLVSQLREDMRTLDDLIVALVPDADFVAAYQQARQINERNRRKRKADKVPPVATPAPK